MSLFVNRLGYKKRSGCI